MKRKLENQIKFLVTIIIAFITFYAQFKDPETGIVMFLILIIMIVIFFITSYPINLMKDKFSQIDANTKDIKSIKEDLNSIKEKIEIRKEIERIKERLSKLER